MSFSSSSSLPCGWWLLAWLGKASWGRMSIAGSGYFDLSSTSHTWLCLASTLMMLTVPIFCGKLSWLGGKLYPFSSCPVLSFPPSSKKARVYIWWGGEEGGGHASCGQWQYLGLDPTARGAEGSLFPLPSHPLRYYLQLWPLHLFWERVQALVRGAGCQQPTPLPGVDYHSTCLHLHALN